MTDQTTPPPGDAAAARRQAALAAADRSIDIEGLPAASAFARSMDAAYIDGRKPAAEIVDALKKHYRQRE